jgi:8-oxo-dGTP pyrophosphatase MutT (NUDIX family)
LPGGGSLPDEGPEDTIIREIREELARAARLVRKIGEAVQYFYAATDDRYYRMQAVFFMAELTDEPSGWAQAEHDLYWLPVAEAEQAFYHQSHAWAARHTLPKTGAG